MDFTVESFFNPQMAAGASRLDAIIAVTATGDGGSVRVVPKRKAVAYLVDVSASMYDDRKLDMAKATVRQAVELLNEEYWFGVITFGDRARVLVPMTQATRAAKDTAHARVGAIEACGGTSVSTALMLAASEFAKIGDAVCYARLLTDGDNSNEDAAELERALGQCEGRFTCDCWGVGRRWRPGDLRRVTDRLLGTTEAVPDPGRLEEMVRESLFRALSRAGGDVRLRLRIDGACRVRSVKQLLTGADRAELTCKADGQSLEVSTGAWSDGESREYHVVFGLEPLGAGEATLVCRPQVVYASGGDDLVKDGRSVVVVWTGEPGTGMGALLRTETGELL